jgi:hypothetical protein
MTSVRIPVAAAVALTVLGPGTASAACFEDIGCTNAGVFSYPALRRLSCDSLWTVRNTIYYENGYCFRTSRGQAVFDNRGCSYNDAGMVPLNHYESQNISRIVRIEREKGCR